MSTPQVNGDIAHSSAFVEHLISYPVINDTVETYKSNRYGQKSIELGASIYQTFAAPVVPYFAKPFEIIKPYVKAADNFGDRALTKVDERFPVIKTPTEELVGGAKALVLLPIRITSAGKDRVVNTYNAEYKSSISNNNNITALGKATITTALILTTESLTTLSNYIGSKKDDVKQAVNERANN